VVVIATTNELLRQEVNRLLSLDPDYVQLEMVRLQPQSRLSRGTIRLLDQLLPAGKIAIYRDNLDFFRSLDALVVAEKTSALLKTRYGLHDLKLIHTRHGAGDRAVGFNKASAKFDFVLVSGPKIRERLASEVGVLEERMATVGYPKFDLPRAAKVPEKFRDTGKPIVLYNPHVSPHLSSWYTQGRDVLEFFLKNPNYNLIFAPHVMLFERKVVLSIDKMRLNFPGKLCPKFSQAPNIHVDLASASSTDMSYTEAADIYLGDASSQIYEFLLRPRPCIFLNSSGVNYVDDPNFAHWKAGRVIGDATELEGALLSASEDHAAYISAQRSMFAKSIDLNSVPSSERAAAAIRGYLTGAGPQPHNESIEHASGGSQVA
jgi:hypothetical protein